MNTNKIFLDESSFYLGDNNILYEKIVGNFDKEKALKAKEIVLSLMDQVEGEVDVLIDLNDAKTQTTEARKIGIEMFELPKNKKIALYGIHPVARVIAGFVIGICKNNNLKFFKTEKEALTWLKEK